MLVIGNFTRAHLTTGTGNYTEEHGKEYSNLFGIGRMETSRFLLLAGVKVYAVVNTGFYRGIPFVENSKGYQLL